MFVTNGVYLALLKNLASYNPIPDLEEIIPVTTIFDEIHRQLDTGCGRGNLSYLSRYYFDGRGKSVRPKLTETMSEAVNAHLGLDLQHK